MIGIQYVMMCMLQSGTGCYKYFRRSRKDGIEEKCKLEGVKEEIGKVNHGMHDLV